MLNNEKNDLRKFDPKSDEWVFMWYYSTWKDYKIYNKRTQCVEDIVNILFDEAIGASGKNYFEDIELEELPKFPRKSTGYDYEL